MVLDAIADPRFMRLFYSPFHSFVHKTLVVAHEAGLWETLTRVPTFPFRDLNGRFVTGQYDMSELAPLGKVPCLALEDGTVLYGSQTIVEFLDAQSVTNRLYPPDGAKRWDALRRLALGDTLFECAVQLSMEAWLPEEARRRTLYEWVWPKIVATLDEAERWAATNPDFDIGSAGLLQGQLPWRRRKHRRPLAPEVPVARRTTCAERLVRRGHPTPIGESTLECAL